MARKSNEYKYQDIALIATYEELLRVPQDQRVTYYFGDYGSHFFKYGVTDEQIQPVYEKALAAIEMTEEDFTDRHMDYLYRGETISRMWDCLLAKELNPGEKVWLVPLVPNEQGNFALCTGVVVDVNSQKKTCTVSTDSMTMDDVPLHFVLGKWGETVLGKHYGLNHMEPFFVENPSMADHYLYEIELSWKAKMNTEPAQDDTAPVLSM